MSKKTICDKCGKVIVDRRDHYILTLEAAHNSLGTELKLELDLCLSCRSEVSLDIKNSKPF